MNQLKKEKLKPIYKKVRILRPFCPICKEQMLGNNSYFLPYRCKCGKWHYDCFKEEWTVKEK